MAAKKTPAQKAKQRRTTGYKKANPARKTSSGKSITSSGRSRYPERVPQSTLKRAVRNTPTEKLMGRSMGSDEFAGKFGKVIKTGGTRTRGIPNQRYAKLASSGVKPSRVVTSSLFRDPVTGISAAYRTSKPRRKGK